MSFVEFLFFVLFMILVDVLICSLLSLVGIIGFVAAMISFAIMLVFGDELRAAYEWLKAKVLSVKGSFSHAV